MTRALPTAFPCLTALLFFATLPLHAQTTRLTVHADRPGVAISPTLPGLMTEEINHSYDGGLYGELLQNRDLKDDAKNPAHWSLVVEGGAAGTLALDTSQPVPGTALTSCLRLDAPDAQGRRVGIANDGYWGIPIRPGTTYRASFYAKAGTGEAGAITVDLESRDGKVVYALGKMPPLTADWRQHTLTLKTAEGTPSTTDARLVLSSGGESTLYLTHISLFGPTFDNRANGLRPDLMEKMAAMHPRFLRLPGGNYLEGNTVGERFDWKKTLGPVEQRPGHQSPWGYRSSDGMGLLEFLEWCEDLHVQPLLAVFAGYALEGEHVDAGPKLTPYVQEALEEIEYVTGDAKTTTWGARRAADGHPAPFPLTYVEVGNEDMYDRSGSYDGRFTQFYDAVKAKYPKLQLIATMDVKSRVPDLRDDHYYRSAAEMESDSRHYDTYPRTAPKVFVGEWASTEGNPTPNMQAALGDAAWLTGLERNADVVRLECYAPLLVNVNPNASQWGTNLIGYDALNSFGSPSYYVQAMFGANQGDVTLPVEYTPSGAPPTAPLPQGQVGVGTWLTQAEFRDAEVTQGGKTLPLPGLSQWTAGGGQWKADGGVLRQTSSDDNCRDQAGDVAWTDYTYHVQARKTGGAEGFLILFHSQDTGNYVWWNVGGWGNARTALERVSQGRSTQIGASAPITVETGRWYDVRIEVQGRAIRCYLEGKLVTEATDTLPAPLGPIYASASRVTKTGDVILKVVNVSARPQPVTVDLEGGRRGGTVTGQVISGEPGDVNSVASPRKVVPIAFAQTDVGSSFVHEFPAHSVTVMRVKYSRIIRAMR